MSGQAEYFRFRCRITCLDVQILDRTTETIQKRAMRNRTASKAWSNRINNWARLTIFTIKSGKCLSFSSSICILMSKLLISVIEWLLNWIVLSGKVSFFVGLLKTNGFVESIFLLPTTYHLPLADALKVVWNSDNCSQHSSSKTVTKWYLQATGTFILLENTWKQNLYITFYEEM